MATLVSQLPQPVLPAPTSPDIPSSHDLDLHRPSRSVSSRDHPIAVMALSAERLPAAANGSASPGHHRPRSSRPPDSTIPSAPPSQSHSSVIGRQQPDMSALGSSESLLDKTANASRPHRRTPGTGSADASRSSKTHHAQKSSHGSSRSRKGSLKQSRDARDSSHQQQQQQRPVTATPAGPGPASRRLHHEQASQFTVGNVGNNGMLYLRPVQRPGQQPAQDETPAAAAPRQRTKPSPLATTAATPSSLPSNPPFVFPPSPAASETTEQFVDNAFNSTTGVDNLNLDLRLPGSPEPILPKHGLQPQASMPRRDTWNTPTIALPPSGNMLAPINISPVGTPGHGPPTTSSQTGSAPQSTAATAGTALPINVKQTTPKQSGLAAPPVRAPLLRSLSQSTVETQLANERHERLEHGSFRVVIERSEPAMVAKWARSQADRASSLFTPSLSVPIPNYRLGTPRFSLMGSALLRASGTERSSVTSGVPASNADIVEASQLTPYEYETLFPRTSGSEPRNVISRGPSELSHLPPYAYNAGPTSPGIAVPRRTPTPLLTRASTPLNNAMLAAPAQPRPSLLPAREPITPAIYDYLTTHTDDPSVVKYSPINGDIIAASPARIIAQVTSDNFLDYELLSDFFLTVRSYLSTHELLSYLMARFEWAVNRFDDHGRVVRVRAFAALRHWILNYFSYDFVIDRPMRVAFCDRINALTRLVNARADYGASDLKLIADLKKCWNGRCLLFWDCELPASPVAGDHLQDMDILPGGVVGSRDSTLEHPIQAERLYAVPVLAEPAPDPSNRPAVESPESGRDSATPQPVMPQANVAYWYDNVIDYHRQQRGLAALPGAETPLTPTSEVSMPAMSCSFPAKALKRLGPYTNKTLESQPPVPPPSGKKLGSAALSAALGMGTSRSPAGPAKYQAHLDKKKRPRSSSSVTEAARAGLEPLANEPAPSVDGAGADAFPERSLMRGYVISPGPPFVTPAPTTLMQNGNNSLDVLLGRSALGKMLPMLDVSGQPGGSHGAAAGKALPNGQQPVNPAAKTFLGNLRRALGSKHATQAAVPLHGSKSAQKHPNAASPAQDGRIEAFRNQLRIDLLAAEAYESYQRIALAPPLAEDSMEDEPPHPTHIGLASGNELEQPSPDSFPEDYVGGTRSGASSRTFFTRPGGLKRLNSGVTDSSQSILIVDDTGDMHSPTEPVHPPPSRLRHMVSAESLLPGVAMRLEEEGSATRAGQRELMRRDSIPMTLDAAVSSPSGKESLDILPAAAMGMFSGQNSRQISRQSHRMSSMQLRRYASYQSTFSRMTYRPSLDYHNFINAAAADLADAPTARNSFASGMQAPARLLRRRPGGDLRANQNVNEMGLRDPRRLSTGSITTYAESFRASFAASILRPSFAPSAFAHSECDSAFRERITQTFHKAPRPFDDPVVGPSSPAKMVHHPPQAPNKLGPSNAPAGQDGEGKARREPRRPSFEAAVARFARIPDDDEGGVEATLLKLEGKYQKSPSIGGTSPVTPQSAMHPINTSMPTLSDDSTRSNLSRDSIYSQSVNATSPRAHEYPPEVRVNQAGLGLSSLLADATAANEDSDRRQDYNSTIYASSDDSYHAVAADEPTQRSGSVASRPIPDALVRLRQGPLPRSHLQGGEASSIASSGGHSAKLKLSSLTPSVTTDSFLLDEDDEFLSDMSSELSRDTVEPIESAEHAEPLTFDDPPQLSDDGFDDPTALPTPMHEPHGFVGGRRPVSPPSPPSATDRAYASRSHAKEGQEQQPQQQPPLTPDPSPTSLHTQPDASGAHVAARDSAMSTNLLGLNAAIVNGKATALAHQRHMPFVLGYEAMVLAQQFTLLEKDALREVDWRDLVDLRWSSTGTATTNWVEYLMTTDPQGIDLVTARFNLVVKWVASEIVLAASAAERAATMVKFIHVAAACRQLHNYATLLQITAALTGADCARLNRAWALVPAAEKDVLQDFELLVTPRRNFHNLRQEMERANADHGCIPVVALYLHDLTYNAQKPASVPSTARRPTAEDLAVQPPPLVNFERFRSTAVIVKSLLRLIDASAQYNYIPIEGLLGRCLWLTALSDEVLAHRSRELSLADS